MAEGRSAPAALKFMEEHGIEVVDLELQECRQMMEEYIRQNRPLWEEFLAELNPDLL